MKLRFLCPYAPLNIKIGAVEEIEDEQAKDLIQRRYAVPVKAEPEKAVLKKAETTKRSKK